MKNATPPADERDFDAVYPWNDVEYRRVAATHEAWWRQVAVDGLMATLFDAVPHLLMFLRDRQGRIRHLNRAARERYGIADEAAVIGKTCYELATTLRPGEPAPGVPLSVDAFLPAGSPELWFDPRGAPNWFQVTRRPVRSADGSEIGSLTLLQPVDGTTFDVTGLGDVARVVEHIHQKYGEPLSVAGLAELALVSVRQLERKFVAAFAVTPKQYLLKVRVSAACRMLAGGATSLADIAADCGFYDQSAFTRYFHQLMGVTPMQFRRQHAGEGRPAG